MTPTETTHDLQVSGLRVVVVRKAIKNLHLGVYPPDGRIRVAVPLAVSDAAVRVAIIGRLRWIRQQQAAFAGQARESVREMVSGETHWVEGRRLRLRVTETRGRPAVLAGRRFLELHVPTDSSVQRRRALLDRFHRRRLRETVPPLLEKWQARLGVEVAAWGIRRMRTKWGSCNERTRRISLNLELAKKPAECLVYVVVHELLHLLVRRHDERFVTLMDQHVPRWREIRATLNQHPLGA